MFIVRKIDQLLDRIFSVLGALVFCQFPQLISQYVDVLSGALAEAQVNIQVFQQQAALVGKSLSELIDKHLSNSDPDFVATGRAMQAALVRLENYEEALNALRDASLFERPFLFFYYLDPRLFEALEFRPGLPLTVEAAVYALIGVLFGLGVYHGIVRLPVYISRMFKKKEPAYAGD